MKKRIAGMLCLLVIGSVVRAQYGKPIMGWVQLSTHRDQLQAKISEEKAKQVFPEYRKRIFTSHKYPFWRVIVGCSTEDEVKDVLAIAPRRGFKRAREIPKELDAAEEEAIFRSMVSLRSLVEKIRKDEIKDVKDAKGMILLLLDRYKELETRIENQTETQEKLMEKDEELENVRQAVVALEQMVEGMTEIEQEKENLEKETEELKTELERRKYFKTRFVIAIVVCCITVVVALVLNAFHIRFYIRSRREVRELKTNLSEKDEEIREYLRENEKLWKRIEKLKT